MSQFENWLFKSPVQRVAEFTELTSNLMPKNIQRILDVGCGNGLLLSHLNRVFPNAYLVGVDISEPNIRAAKATFADMSESLTFVVADYLKYAAKPNDLIVSYSTLNLIPIDSGTLLKKISDDLVTGGLIITSMPYDCLHNRFVIVFRRMLASMRCNLTNRLIYTIGRLLCASDVSNEQIIQNIDYMYIVPTHLDGKVFREIAKKFDLSVIDSQKEKSSSFVKLKYKVIVMQKSNPK